MWRYLLCVSCLFVPASSIFAGQINPRPGNLPPSTQTQSPAAPRFPGDQPEEPDPFRENSRQRARALERQKRMVDDANRLVKLTAQYRGDVERHGSVTAEDQKLLLQIEKLAREVKDRMRGM